MNEYFGLNPFYGGSQFYTPSSLMSGNLQATNFQDYMLNPFMGQNAGVSSGYQMPFMGDPQQGMPDPFSFFSQYFTKMQNQSTSPESAALADTNTAGYNVSQSTSSGSNTYNTTNSDNTKTAQQLAQEEKLRKQKIAEAKKAQDAKKIAMAKQIAAKKAAEAKLKEETRSLTWGERFKSIGKGLVKSVTGMFTDKNGKFSWKQTAITVGVAAGVVALEILTAGAATPFLIGAGVAMGGLKVGTGVYKAASAQTVKDAKAAYEEIGEGAGDLGLCLVAKKGYTKSKAARIEQSKNIVSSISTAASKSQKASKAELEAVQNSIQMINSANGKTRKVAAALKEIQTATKGNKNLSEIHFAAKESMALIKPKVFNFNQKSLLDNIPKQLTKQQRKELTAAFDLIGEAKNKKGALKAIKQAKATLAGISKEKGEIVQIKELELALINAEKQIKSTGLIRTMRSNFKWQSVKDYRTNFVGKTTTDPSIKASKMVIAKNSFGVMVATKVVKDQVDSTSQAVDDMKEAQEEALKQIETQETE